MSFTITIVIFSLILAASAVAALIYLGLWVWNDASERTDNPLMWTLIVLLVPSLIGLIIYMLVGRDRYGYSTGRFRNQLIASTVIFAVALCGLISTSVSITNNAEFASEIMTMFEGRGVSADLHGNVHDEDGWAIGFISSDEKYSLTVNMTSHNLSAFNISCGSLSGKVYLTINQGDLHKQLDITNTEGKHDLRDYGFSPGDIELIVSNDNAKAAGIAIAWK